MKFFLRILLLIQHLTFILCHIESSQASHNLLRIDNGFPDVTCVFICFMSDHRMLFTKFSFVKNFFSKVCLQNISNCISTRDNAKIENQIQERNTSYTFFFIPLYKMLQTELSNI